MGRLKMRKEGVYDGLCIDYDDTVSLIMIIV